MNELMLALEAMIRRVVQEEFEKTELKDFSLGLKIFADNKPAEFAALISQGALDQIWFDEAVKAEATESAARVVAEQSGVTFEDLTAFRRLCQQMVFDDGENALNDIIRSTVREMDFSCLVEVR